MSLPTPPNGDESHRQSRAKLMLAGVAGAAFAVVIVAVVVAVMILRPSAPPAAPGVPAPPQADNGGWDVAAESALATAPMLQLPREAQQPHALGGTPAGPPITVPAPTQTQGTLVPRGFPGTPEGALGQLAALMKAELAGLDPDVLKKAYASVSLPGAPLPWDTKLGMELAQFRNQYGSAAGPLKYTTSTLQPLEGLIKGTADDGRFAVVCVLAEMTITDMNVDQKSLGEGDCQAMRFVDGNWSIAPAPAAAPAPEAWPGTPEAAAAGYRPLAVP